MPSQQLLLHLHPNEIIPLAYIALEALKVRLVDCNFYIKNWQEFFAEKVIYARDSGIKNWQKLLTEKVIYARDSGIKNWQEFFAEKVIYARGR